MIKFSIKAVASATILGGLLAGAVSASAALNLPTQNTGYQFNTNLRLGSKGVDVMNLQKVLNAYPQTRVAESGAGSPGMETSTFGPATRAAVNKFQALHLVDLGITAPTGNVFAGTRGLLNMLTTGTSPVSTLPAGCTSTVGFSSTTGVSCSTGTTTTVPGTTVSGPVSVMLAPTQPSGLLVAGQAAAKLADLTFTGNGTVSSIELQRTGVSSDSTLTNVYLYDGNTRISDAASVVTGGFIRFNATSGLFTVNGTRTISVRADIATGTSGASVGVKLNSLTVTGGSPSTFTNVMGAQLQIGTAGSIAAVNFASIDNSGSCNSLLNTVCVDAGTQAYNVWSGSASVNTRDVLLRSATFKFVGSAPVDSLANISLYVDGSKVAGPVAINAANNNKLSFDLGATPYTLKTGAHTFDVRGDVVKGSNRTMTFSVENVSDLFLEDSNLAGVNIAATIGGATFTQSLSTYKSVLVNRGSVTVNVDSAFVANKVTGGATNVPVAQFTVKAYGEDVKFNTLSLTPSLTNPAISGSTTPVVQGLPNVSLYLNGGQIGTSQNWTSGALTYTLGSSLIVPAGQTVTLTVKADINNTASAAYTAGVVAVTLNAGSNNVQGQSSNELNSTSAAIGNSLTISSGVGTFARTAGFTGVSVAPNSTNVKIGSFTLQANSSESIKITSVGVKPTVASGSISNYSNLTVKDGSTVLGTPVGNPTTGTSTFSISGDLIIPANGTKTLDVYADVSGDVDATITADMDINYRGVISNTSSVSTAAGATISSAVATLAASTRSSQSPVAQFVVGGTSYNVATFVLKTAVSGTSANVRELRFSITGTDAVQSVTVGGVTAPVVSGTSTVTGLNIPVSSIGTDVPVTVKYSQFQNNAKGEAGSLTTSVASSVVSLTYVEATSGSGSIITDVTASAASNAATLVASKPTVTVSAGGTDSLNVGALSKIGEFTVSADANGKIAMASTSLSISVVGVTGPELATSSLVLKDNGVNVTGVSLVTNAGATASTTPVFTFTTPYEIGAGQSKTFSVYGTISGTVQNGIVPRSNVSLTSGATFKWLDVIGGNSIQTGASIYNFPTNSYTTKTN